MTPIARLEWQTLAVLVLCHGLWVLSVMVLPAVSLTISFVLAAIAIALHSSLQHEALHGHPTRIAWLNEALVFLPVGLFIPYRRFRDTHLAHHRDERLTDPYDDPETNFLDPKLWARLPRSVRILRLLNNTLLGRILLGPAISIRLMLVEDLRSVARREVAVIWAWVLHGLGLLLLFWLLATLAIMPFWLYVLAAYLAFGLLKIRTYLEHRAHLDPNARTVLIEDRGPLAFLFLNNNLHVVHHQHPGRPWYQLPTLLRAGREDYLVLNDGYFYASYTEVFRRYFFKAKDPVPHPLWSVEGEPGEKP